MANSTTVMALGPLVMGAITLPIPEFSLFYFWLSLLIYIPVLIYAVYLDLTGKSKSKKSKGYVGYYCLVLMSIYFGLPAVKVLSDHPIFQLGIILLWLGLSVFAFKYNQLTHAVFLGQIDKYRKYTFLLHGSMLLALVAGGGGYYKAAEYFSYIFGKNAMFEYFSILLLVGSYWLGIFAQSTVGIFTKFR